LIPQHVPAALGQLNEYRNLHLGETFLVCGCGPSLAHFTAPDRFLTIGVNDVGRLIEPDYLVVLNPKHQFSGDRFRFVEESRATAVFSHLPLKLQHAPIVPVRLGRRGGVEDADPGALHYTRNSPYMAVCLAMHMGAARIGLLGVDFTEHHFFGQTGRHPLAGELRQIDAEYQRLFTECERRGIELFNLSPESKLTSIPKLSQQQFTIRSLAPPVAPILEGRRVFFVHYRFQTCGEVFRDGIEPAAGELGLDFATAHSFDPDLEAKITAFNPELLFVVHGRKFHHRMQHLLERYNSAIWLLDEPYEVDDTSRFSSHFRTVFVNDPETLSRHSNAHYLPVCYNPYDSACSPGPRRYRVGFIGDADPARERLLAPLAERGLLSYVAGGPWHSAALRALSLGQRIPAEQTTALYRETEIILNIFRTKHHFNARRSGGTSLNPRIYESAANGALPLSESRPELQALWPQAPTFHDEASLTLTLQTLLDDPLRIRALTASAVRAFRFHTYANRLRSALAVALEPKPVFSLRCSMPVPQPAVPAPIAELPPLPLPELPGWLATPEVAQQESNGTIILARANNDAPGSERGLLGTESLEDLTLSFEVWLDPGSSFLAKLHQQDQTDQASNSYHLHVTRSGAILARHNHVLGRTTFPFNSWVKVSMRASGNRLAVHIDDQIVAITDDLLPRGFCFIGIKGGRALLRNISLVPGTPADKALPPEPAAYTILLRSTPRDEQPLLSIITTVYDRVQCLDDCLTSLENLTYRNFEHLIVADAPEPSILQELAEVIERHPTANNRLFANLAERHNDWGIAPAAAGLAMSTGKYVAFLSDDNGYLPDHFEPLIAALERDANLGFAYSSCLYAGRHVLRRPRPCAGGIDLGQPVLRRETLDRHLNGTLPFAEFGWDWRMIERLLRARVRYTHIDRASFIFRLHQYPHLKQAHA
jgi:Glycosyl transferase family 2/Glycosyl transferases group 1